MLANVLRTFPASWEAFYELYIIILHI